MLIDADQLDTSPPEWLVDGMIPRVGAGFWYGKRYTGKSLATDVELALAVGNGADFFGRKTVQGTVVVGLGEGLYDAGIRKQARLIRERADRIEYAAQIAVAHGDDVAKAWLDAQPEYTDDNVKYLTEPFTVPVTREDGEGLMTRSMAAFISKIKAKKYRDLELIVLDSLSDFTGGLSISNDTSANRLMLGLKMLVRELDCFVLCVAHPTEKGDKMLGAGRLGNAADLIVRSVPENDANAGNGMVSTVSCEKNKYGKRFDPFSYIVDDSHEWDEPVLDDDGEPTGETYVATSATIRPLDLEKDDSIRPSRPKRPLPELRTAASDKPRKRSGIVKLVK
jgi:hypothetical protein